MISNDSPMKPNHLLLWVLFLWLPLAGISQKTDYREVDYSAVDAWVRGLDSKNIDNYYMLAYLIEEKFQEPHLRARAIYTWLGENIDYDCKAYHRKSLAKCDPWDVFKNRKAICGGFANLFKELCDLQGVECEVVTGIAITNTGDVGKKDIKENHAWNRIKLGSDWYLVDATWGAGYTDYDVKTFTRDVDDMFFLTPPEQFIRHHYPTKRKMQMLDIPVSKSKFINHPFSYCGFLKNELVSVFPNKYLINAEVDKKIKFSFKTLEHATLKNVSLEIEGKKKQLASPVLLHNNDSYSFEYSFDKPGTYYMTILVNSLHTSIYVVSVKGEPKKATEKQSKTAVGSDILTSKSTGR